MGVESQEGEEPSQVVHTAQPSRPFWAHRPFTTIWRGHLDPFPLGPQARPQAAAPADFMGAPPREDNTERWRKASMPLLSAEYL